MFRARLGASETTPFKFNANWRGLGWECSSQWTSENKIDVRNNFKDMRDHRSHAHHLGSCENKAWKKKSGLNGMV